MSFLYFKHCVGSSQRQPAGVSYYVILWLLRPWSTMECSQPSAWITNRSLLVTSRAKAFPGRRTNAGSTLPGAAHLEGGVIVCHQCITSHSGSAPASPDMHAIVHLHPCPHPNHHSHYGLRTFTNGDYLVGLPRVDLALLRVILRRLW